jgi:hypothetical protein
MHNNLPVEGQIIVEKFDPNSSFEQHLEQEQQNPFSFLRNSRLFSVFHIKFCRYETAKLSPFFILTADRQNNSTTYFPFPGLR